MYDHLKPVIDLTLGVILLVLLSPLMLLLTVTQIFLHRGSPFFLHQRPGKNGKLFRMIKFRTMENCLDASGALMPDNKRVTAFGRILRRTSMDELPQLINVIKGDMSIVGPRPLPVYEQEQCNEYQSQRLLVQGGLTCYWQVCGRASVPFDEWVEMDLRYIREQGVWVDLKLIMKTMISVVRLAGGFQKNGSSLNK